MPDAVQEKLTAILRDLDRKISDSEASLVQSVEELRALLAEVEHDRSHVQSDLEQRQLDRLLRNASEESHESCDNGVTAELRSKEHDLLSAYSQVSVLYRQVTDFTHLLTATRQQLSSESELPGIDDQQRMALRQAMIRAQEDERRRLSREIHDGPAQVLANAIIGLEFIERAINNAKKTGDLHPEKELDRIRIAMREGLSEIRRFIFDLRPSMLSQRGLTATIEHYVETYRHLLPDATELSVPSSLPRLSPEQELAAFRVMQESLQNIHRHAESTQCGIAVSSSADQICVRIRDNGNGFDPSEVSTTFGSGSGIIGMKERAEAVGARLSIDSAPGKGCDVLLQIPLATPQTRDSTQE